MHSIFWNVTTELHPRCSEQWQHTTELFQFEVPYCESTENKVMSHLPSRCAPEDLLVWVSISHQLDTELVAPLKNHSNKLRPGEKVLAIQLLTNN